MTPLNAGQTYFETAPTRRGVALNGITAWVPALLGMLVICCESTRIMGADHTTAWLGRLCSPLVNLATADVIELNHILRKCGHFIGYGALGVLYMRGWISCLVPKLSSKRVRLGLFAGALGVVSAFCIASMDELHQSFLPNRSACFSDVLLDTSGAMLFVVITTLLLRTRLREMWLGLALFGRRSMLGDQHLAS